MKIAKKTIQLSLAGILHQSTISLHAMYLYKPLIIYNEIEIMNCLHRYRWLTFYAVTPTSFPIAHHTRLFIVFWLLHMPFALMETFRTEVLLLVQVVNLFFFGYWTREYPTRFSIRRWSQWYGNVLYFGGKFFFTLIQTWLFSRFTLLRVSRSVSAFANAFIIRLQLKAFGVSWLIERIR